MAEIELIDPSDFPRTMKKTNPLVVRLDNPHAEMLDAVLTRFNINQTDLVTGYIESLYKTYIKKAGIGVPASKKTS